MLINALTGSAASPKTCHGALPHVVTHVCKALKQENVQAQAADGDDWKELEDLQTKMEERTD